MAHGARCTLRGASPMNNIEIVQSFFACWSVQDVELASMHYHPDMEYELHSGMSEFPYVGVTRGKAAVRDLLFTIIKDFDYLKYESQINGAEGDIVRARVSFKYQHRQSGEILEGTRRLVFRLKDGLIIRMDRYHDDQLVDAFIRLTQHHVTSAQAEKPPAPRKVARHQRCQIGLVQPPVTRDHDRPGSPRDCGPAQLPREVS